MDDRIGQRERLRVISRARRYLTARAAQAELRRRGHDPGRLLGAVERLGRVTADESSPVEGDRWR